MMLRFEDRVVLVTGAGNGLGREYALAFGGRGASVIVNDLGGDSRGEGKSSRPADLVVEEIIANGGKAVANYDSVEEGAKLVEFAIEKFGRIDVIVHNAGILRDKSFIKMSDSDWDLIQKIHLRSVFLITRAAWPHMLKQKFGRIVTISSSAGIYGNFGQANYSAAKSGVVGLTRTLALEGKKYNVLCNSVAPIAGSRLTRTIMPDDVADALKAKYVSPLVLWLCHEDCKDTGNLFECGAGWVGKLRWERTDGKVVRRKDEPMLPEDVRDNWEQICDFKHSHHPVNIHDANATYFSTLQAFDEKESEDVRPSNEVSSAPSKISEATFNYCERDVILYAIGVGVSTKNDDHLRFLYENASNFCTLPTFAISPLASLMSETLAECTINGNGVDLSQVLHGEQYLELFRPLPTTGTLCCKSHIAALLDKGSGAAAVINVDISDSTGSKIGFAQGVIFIQRAGGFGGERSSKKVVPLGDHPKRSPDTSVDEATFVDQAAIYRLSGDKNPLHIDPSFASLGGFPTPILHGLATYGIAARQVLKMFCDNDVTKFKAIKARFSSPVLPGQALRTDMWKEGKRIHFETKVLETGKVCLAGGYVDLNDNSSPSLLSKL